MANHGESSAMEEMLRLLKRKVGQEITHDDFRQAYEEIYNFRLNLSLLTDDHMKALESFFDVVARYSPFPDDRAENPGVYRDEREMDEALARLRKELGLVVG